MIEGKLINLRAVEDEDAAMFFRWFNDPEATRFLGANAFPLVSMAQEHAFIAGLRDEKGRHFYVITTRDGSAIGNCTLRSFDWTARSCEVGIAIGEKAALGPGLWGATRFN